MPIDLAALSTHGWSPSDDRGVRIRALQPGADAPLLNGWFNLPQAAFWGMQGQPVDETRDFYERMQRSGHAVAGMGIVDACPAFIVECYDPGADLLAEHYTVEPGDLGMHFFVGPAQMPVHGFTRRVFRSIMRLAFGPLRARRVVVEPDVRNHKVHVLNAAMGFAVQKDLQLPHKRARLSWCTRADFELANRKELAA